MPEAAGHEGLKKKKEQAAPETALTAAGMLFKGQKSVKKRKKLYLLEQWVEVVVEDGKTITRLYPSNKNLIERGKTMWPAPDLVYRRINFPGGVPEEYRWVGMTEDRANFGGAGLQRLTPDTWLKVIEREGPEIPREGYQSSVLPGHIGPTGVGNLPRPKERGGCDCEVCVHNQALIDQQEEAAGGEKAKK